MKSLEGWRAAKVIEGKLKAHASAIRTRKKFMTGDAVIASTTDINHSYHDPFTLL